MSNEIWHTYQEGLVLYALIWRKTDDKIISQRPGLFKELYMTAMQYVITAGNKYLLHEIQYLLSISRGIISIIRTENKDDNIITGPPNGRHAASGGPTGRGSRAFACGGRFQCRAGILSV